MNNQAILVLLAAIGLLAPVWAQTGPASAPPQTPSTETTPRRTARAGTTGVITGTVKDDTGGVIPGATVTLANESGTVQTVKSSGDGSYRFRGVPVGVYTVSAAFTGLQQEGVTAISLTAGQSAIGNITMT